MPFSGSWKSSNFYLKKSTILESSQPPFSCPQMATRFTTGFPTPKLRSKDPKAVTPQVTQLTGGSTLPSQKYREHEDVPENVMFPVSLQSLKMRGPQKISNGSLLKWSKMIQFEDTFPGWNILRKHSRHVQPSHRVANNSPDLCWIHWMPSCQRRDYGFGVSFCGVCFFDYIKVNFCFQYVWYPEHFHHGLTEG